MTLEEILKFRYGFMDEKLAIDLLAGAAGGCASVIVGQPLDTVKVKMQLYPHEYKVMYSCLARIIRKQGMRGLYAGTLPALMSNCAENAVMFGTYGQCQKLVASITNTGVETKNLNYLQNAAAGGIASIFTSVVICPAELIKVRMQSDYGIGKNRLTAAGVIKNIWNAGGFRGFYRGLSVTVAREIIGGTLFFGAYEWARENLKPKGKPKEECDALSTMAAGAFAGIVNWMTVYPLDVIKSQIQSTKDDSVRKLIRQQIGQGSFRALYSGLWPTLMKTIPATAVLLFGVEFSKPFFVKCFDKLKEISSHPIFDKEVFSYCDFLSGWTAGMVSTCIGHPLDTIRIVQQVKDVNPYAATGEIYKTHRFSGFYRGMMFPVLSSGVVNSVVFGVNGNTMRYIQTHFRDNVTENDRLVRVCCNSESLHKYWHLDYFVSGCVAGFFSTLINIPVELIKTKLQASNVENTLNTENSPIQLTRQLYRQGGIRTLYRGGTVLLFRDVPATGIYMLSYEHICCLLRNQTEGQRKPDDSFSWPIQVFAGGMAGVISWATILPLDVIKTKMMTDDTQYNGIWDCIKITYKSGGVLRFYQGFWVMCLRAFPVNSVAFLVYEFLMKTCLDPVIAPANDGDLKATNIETKRSKWL